MKLLFFVDVACKLYGRSDTHRVCQLLVRAQHFLRFFSVTIYSLELPPFLNDFLLLAYRGLHKERVLKFDGAFDVLVKLNHKFLVLLYILLNMRILKSGEPDRAFKRCYIILDVNVYLVALFLLFVAYVL